MLAAGGHARRDPFGRPLGRGVHVGRVGAQGLAGGRAHHLRHPGLGRAPARCGCPARWWTPCGAPRPRPARARAARPRGKPRRAGSPGSAPRARPRSLTSAYRYSARGVRGPAAGDAAAHADQAVRAARGQLGHQRRADAARSAGHQHRGAPQPGQLAPRAGRARVRRSPGIARAPRRRRSLAVMSACGELPQLCEDGIVETPLTGRRDRAHAVNDLPDRLHPATSTEGSVLSANDPFPGPRGLPPAALGRLT